MTDQELKDWVQQMEMLRERNRLIRLSYCLKAIQREITDAEEEQFQVIRGLVDLIESGAGNYPLFMIPLPDEINGASRALRKH